MSVDKLNILIFDCGLYVHQSLALSEMGHTVRYYTPVVSKDPHYRDFAIGKGLGKMEKIFYFEDSIEWADLIIYWDVAGNAQCNYLRKMYPKKAIYGAGLGERLENNRVLLKEWCKELGLDVNKYEVVKGVTALKNSLKKSNGNKYVKINIFRGDLESFYAEDFESADSIIDQEVIPALGAHKEDYEFIIEEPIKTDVEVGADIFFNGRNMVGGFYGYEVSKGLYLGKKIESKLPDILQETIDAFTPLLSKMDYRGALSTEEKCVSKNEHYFIDACMRLPNPLSALYPVMIENWDEFIYSIANGGDIEPEIKYKYVGAFPLTSTYAKENYVKVDIKDTSKVRYQMCCGKGKDIYSVPQWEVVAIVVAGADTVEGVISQLKANVEYVDGHGIDKDPINGIDIVKDIIKNGVEVGIPF